MDLLTPKDTLQQCTTSAYTEAEHQQEGSSSWGLPSLTFTIKAPSCALGERCQAVLVSDAYTPHLPWK